MGIQAAWRTRQLRLGDMDEISVAAPAPIPQSYPQRYPLPQARADMPLKGPLWVRAVDEQASRNQARHLRVQQDGGDIASGGPWTSRDFLVLNSSLWETFPGNSQCRLSRQPGASPAPNGTERQEGGVPPGGSVSAAGLHAWSSQQHQHGARLHHHSSGLQCSRDGLQICAPPGAKGATELALTSETLWPHDMLFLQCLVPAGQATT